MRKRGNVSDEFFSRNVYFVNVLQITACYASIDKRMTRLGRAAFSAVSRDNHLPCFIARLIHTYAVGQNMERFGIIQLSGQWCLMNG